MQTCAVLSCDSNTHSKSVTLFRIPNNQEEAEGWMNFLTEANSGAIIPPFTSGRLYVCSKHFRKCCIYPCNPRRISRITGHYPSVLEGKVIENVNSKCALISADENLQVYVRPLYHSAQEQQRNYLVKQLTSFSVQRKIVIGSTSGSKSHIMKTLNENQCLDTNKNVMTVQTLTDRPKICSQATNTAHCSSTTPTATSDGKGQEGQSNNKSYGTVLLKSKKQVNRRLFPPVVVAAKQEIQGENRFQVTLKKSVTNRQQFTTRPSAETKLRLLLRDNVNLKRSVRVLEGKVEEMEVEVKRFRDNASDLETRYKRMMKSFQKRLREKPRKHSGTVIAKVSKCKCALIDVVDISED